MTNFIEYCKPYLEKIRACFPSLGIISFLYFLPSLINDSNFFEGSTWRSIGYVPSMAAHDSGRVFVGALTSFFSGEYQLFPQAEYQFFIETGMLNQVISIIFMLLASIIFYHRINPSKYNFFYGLVIFSFLINPYILDTLSYKTACLYMIVPNCLVLIAASLNSKNPSIDIILGSILVTLSFGLYQASFNVLCGAIILVFLCDYLQNSKNALSNLFENAAKFILGSAIYKYLILNRVETGEYYERNISSYALDANFLKNIYSRFIELSNNYLFNFSESNIIMVFSIFAVLAYAFYYLSKKDNKLMALIIFITSAFFILFFCFGFLVYFKTAVYGPRVLAGFSILFIFLFHGAYSFLLERAPQFSFILVIPVLYFTLISYSYSSMQRYQYTFEKRVASSIINQLEASGLDKKGEKSICYEGEAGAAPYAQNTIRRNKILKSLFFENLRGSWSSWIFSKHLGIKKNFFDIPYPEKLAICKSQKEIFRSSYFKIFEKPEFFLVAFKGSNCYKN